MERWEGALLVRYMRISPGVSVVASDVLQCNVHRRQSFTTHTRDSLDYAVTGQARADTQGKRREHPRTRSKHRSPRDSMLTCIL